MEEIAAYVDGVIDIVGGYKHQFVSVSFMISFL